MIRRLWYGAVLLALKLRMKPVKIFIVLHTILWCDLAWIACRLGCAVLEIPAVLHHMEIFLIIAYVGVFIGIIGGAIYLVHEDLV